MKLWSTLSLRSAGPQTRPKITISTGLAELDRLLGGGLRSHSLYVLTGPPGVGKSGLALQIARQVASSGMKALYISTELDEEQVAARIIAPLIGRGFDKINVHSQDQDVSRAVASTLSLQLQFGWSRDIEDILTTATETKPDLLVLDYMQTLARRLDRDRRQDVSSISDKLTQFANDTGSTVLTVSSVARSSYSGWKDKPSTWDDAPKESGDVDYDASGIVSLTSDGILMLIKHRYGQAPASAKVYFDGALGCFKSMNKVSRDGKSTSLSN